MTFFDFNGLGTVVRVLLRYVFLPTLKTFRKNFLARYTIEPKFFKLFIQVQHKIINSYTFLNNDNCYRVGYSITFINFFMLCFSAVGITTALLDSGFVFISANAVLSSVAPLKQASLVFFAKEGSFIKYFFKKFNL